MKTKHLIEILQKADPSGELHVCTNYGAILSAEQLPGYYDGHYEYVEQDTTGRKKFYVTNRGSKVKIMICELEDMVWDNCESDIVIDDSLADFQEARVKSIIYHNKALRDSE